MPQSPTSRSGTVGLWFTYAVLGGRLSDQISLFGFLKCWQVCYFPFMLWLPWKFRKVLLIKPLTKKTHIIVDCQIVQVKIIKRINIMLELVLLKWYSLESADVFSNWCFDDDFGIGIMIELLHLVDYSRVVLFLGRNWTQRILCCICMEGKNNIFFW